MYQLMSISMRFGLNVMRFFQYVGVWIFKILKVHVAEIVRVGEVMVPSIL